MYSIHNEKQTAINAVCFCFLMSLRNPAVKLAFKSKAFGHIIG